MRSWVYATLFLAFCPFLAAQEATAPSAAPAQATGNSASSFNFTKIDDDLFIEAGAVDALYERKGLVMHDPAMHEYVDSVARRVIDNRPAPERVEFKFRVLRDPMVNAFALPNGSVYVTTGLLALLENEAQLAGVLGHETGHVFERHSYLQNRSVRKKALTLNVLSIAGSVAPVGPGLSTGVQAFGAAVQLGAALSSVVLVSSVYGYSREMEWQADSDGLTAMTAASYDPHAMARAFELLDSDSRLEYEPIESFYHDHPKLTERRASALEFASAHNPSQPRVVAEKDYLAAVGPAIAYNITTDIESRRPRSAFARASKIAAIFPDDPKYQVLLADSYRALGARTTTPSDEELTHHGQREHRKEYFSMTEQEEENRLVSMPVGEATLHGNQASAEKTFLAVIQSHPTYSPAYRDLGFLYEDESRYTDAAGAYHHYLDQVASTSLDHLRIEQRLAKVQKLQAH